MTPNLITLTASDLRGCDPFPCSLNGFDALFVAVNNGRIMVDVYGLGSATVSEPIQCHPYDFSRAWLGPRGEMFPAAEVASIKEDIGFCFERTLSDNGVLFPICFLACPAALASAMGSSVWRRTETGWEVVE